MQDNGHILVINPGSTSTKLALFQFDLRLETLMLARETTVDHAAAKMSQSSQVLEQLDLRRAAVENFLETFDSGLNLIMARGAPLRPMQGGVYEVDQTMINDVQSAVYANHASNLAVLIGRRIALKINCPVYIADPITTDEFEPLARISGVPGIERKSRSHALNIKASTRELCRTLNKDFNKSRWVVSHMGGGISVAALKNGRIIDVNDALLGMGPFGPERSGALPIAGLLDLAYSGKHTRSELEIILSQQSGLKAYLGTADLREVEDMIASNDKQASLIFDAMVYQIAKEIAGMLAVLCFKLDGIILTGGMAYSKKLCKSISERMHPDIPIHIQAGENEMEALAQAGFRVLLNKEPLLKYAQ
ncbi:butyrate kinase [bacterium]|nr:butyrate kinase [bacterium]